MKAFPTHSYVVPAYGRSPHLEACLDSLVRQTRPCEIVIATSTPFEDLDALAGSYGARVVRHGPNAGIGQDWNAAFNAATTDLVTIAHQDDIYAPEHHEKTASEFSRHPDVLIGFTECVELVDGALRGRNRTTSVKSVLREFAFLGRSTISSRFAKTRLLSFGNAIPCPAVTISKSNVPHFAFRTDLRTNMDWAAWLDLARRDGAFLTLREPLVFHRIHSASETTACIEGGQRRSEDLEMFETVWPPLVARGLAKLYEASYSTNG